MSYSDEELERIKREFREASERLLREQRRAKYARSYKQRKEILKRKYKRIREISQLNQLVVKDKLRFLKTNSFYNNIRKKLKLTAGTSYYYAFKKGYIINPYSDIDKKLYNNYKSLFRFGLLGSLSFLKDTYGKLSEKVDFLNKTKDLFVNLSSNRSIALEAIRRTDKILNKKFDEWFPGKYGKTKRLIQAWITRKKLYGESGIRQLPYGGFQRRYSLGVTFGKSNYLSLRRRVRSIQRGFRKGGGFRRFA
jgi:hypothetical protein